MESGYEFVITLDSDKERKIEMAPGDVFTYKFLRYFRVVVPDFHYFSINQAQTKSVQEILKIFLLPIRCQ